ncbi:ABC transporter substrate-binding protein [Ligilactobacillus equi]|uniref:tryptophan ABC transporter substrate-binding protein n=1 Tax=Ligilactobacillus equi TaxID=137357 RepID=UPI002ED493A7
MKRLIASLAILFSFLTFALVKQTNDQKQNTKPIIGILQLMSHPALDEIHQGVVAGLKSEGYRNGKNIEIDYQNAQNDQSNLKSMSDRFKNKNTTLMIGIATPAAQSLANVAGNTPVIMGAISDPVKANLVKSLSHPGGNVTGVQHVEPVKKQVQMIKSLSPDIKTMGVIYTSSDDASTGEAKEFMHYAKEAGIKTQAYTVTSTNDINQVADTMVSKVQGVYVPTDNTIASGMSTLIKTTDTAKIPVYAAADTMVKNGAVGTFSISQYQMGVLTGKIAAQVLKGKKPADIPVQHTEKGVYSINLKVAQKLGISIPEDILQVAQKKGSVYK